MAPYVATIGLECHAQLDTRSKMFCACPVVQDAPPNTAVCPTCLGHPGTLPTLNDGAIHLGLRAALATGCTLHSPSGFDRKHYFYPDLPKGYQITQNDRPFATGGTVHAGGRTFAIQRMHFEEDSGKMLHSPSGSLLDWNRAGVPLVEIVSEADMRTPEQAEAYLRTLHRVLVEGGVCTGDMEKGHFRCDANVSVHREGEPWGTRVEVKNVNSFRFVAKAIRYEIDRQVAILANGGRVMRETRAWSTGRTVSLRGKESASDYRYLPEPDLGPLVLDEAEIAHARGMLPGVPLDLHLAEMDRERTATWVSRYGLGDADIAVILGNLDAARLFVQATGAGGHPKAMANWVMGEVLRRGDVGKLTGEHLRTLQEHVDTGRLNRDGAKQVLDALWLEGGAVADVASRLGLGVIRDAGQLSAIIQQLLAAHPRECRAFVEGNQGMVGFFMGKLMTATDRRADPVLAQSLLREALKRLAG